MARSTKEWIGKNDDDWPPPVECQRRVIRRSNGKCAMCTRTLDGKLRPHMDHIRSLASSSLYPGENLNRESNLQALCEECHVRIKTPKDRKESAEIARYERRRYGLEKPQKRKNRGVFVWRTADGTLRWTGWRKGAPPPAWIKGEDK